MIGSGDRTPRAQVRPRSTCDACEDAIGSGAAVAQQTHGPSRAALLQVGPTRLRNRQRIRAASRSELESVFGMC